MIININSVTCIRRVIDQGGLEWHYGRYGW